MASDASLRELFEELLATPADQRAELFARVTDAQDRARLAAMVAAEEEAIEAEDPSPERAFPWPGDHVGSYRLLAPVGAGGMGSVWAAESRRTPGIRVAVKFASASHVGADESALRLEQERRILTHLDHPGVARLIDAGDAGAKGGFLVLVFVYGRTFDDYARGAGTQALMRAVGELSRTLDDVHSEGIVHRDLKPSNVLVDERGWPTVIDFGMARVMEDSALTSRHVTQGVAPHTPAFASPEQQSGGPVTARTDVFGLAKLVEACCEAASIKIDAELRAILSQACSDEPAERHATPGELGADLERWAAPGGPETTWAASMPVRVALGVGLVAFGAGLALWSVGGAREDADPASDVARQAALSPAFFDELAEMPVDALPRELATYERLAEDEPGRGWEVAAGWVALESGLGDDARSWARRAQAEIDEVPVQRLVELGELSARLGLLEAAADALEEAGGRVSEEEEALEFLALELRYRIRSGARVDWNGAEEIIAMAASIAEARDLPVDALMDGLLGEEREDELFGSCHERALETGQLPFLKHWLNEVETQRRRSPLEEPTRLLYGLLSVHARRVLGGAA
ncbi:MAG: serine/threonine-protein kinase, partial [Planctomycetota bacterium]